MGWSGEEREAGVTVNDRAEAERRARGRGAGTERGAGVTDIGIDLAGLLGDAWRVPKVGPCRVGWHMGRGVPSPAD